MRLCRGSLGVEMRCVMGDVGDMGRVSWGTYPLTCVMGDVSADTKPVTQSGKSVSADTSL